MQIWFHNRRIKDRKHKGRQSSRVSGWKLNRKSVLSSRQDSLTVPTKTANARPTYARRDSTTPECEAVTQPARSIVTRRDSHRQEWEVVAQSTHHTDTRRESERPECEVIQNACTTDGDIDSTDQHYLLDCSSLHETRTTDSTSPFSEAGMCCNGVTDNFLEQLLVKATTTVFDVDNLFNFPVKPISPLPKSPKFSRLYTILR